jgi:hypothetical protein
VRHPQGFRIFDLPIRDQEVDGSNPFAPTILLESAAYIMRKSEERLVRQPGVLDSYQLYASALVALCPVNSLLCNRRFALFEIRFSGDQVQD